MVTQTYSGTTEIYIENNLVYSEVVDNAGIIYRVVDRNNKNHRTMEVESYGGSLKFKYWKAHFENPNFDGINEWVDFKEMNYYPVTALDPTFSLSPNFSSRLILSNKF